MLKIVLYPVLCLRDCILLSIVFGVCMAFAGNFNFNGGFLFLHIINPVLATRYSLLFADMTKIRIISSLLVAVFSLPYLAFVLVFGSITGNYICFFMNYESAGVGYTVIFITAFLILIILFGFAFCYLNKLIHRRFLKSENALVQ